MRKRNLWTYRLEWHNMVDGWQARRGLEQSLIDDIRGKNVHDFCWLMEPNITGLPAASESQDKTSQ
jgi:hypothetical protein